MTAFNAGLPNRNESSQQFPIGYITELPVRSFQPVKLPDRSVWLQSGSVVPAYQAPRLAGNPAFRAVVPSVVNTPISLSSGNGFKFFPGANPSVAFYFNAVASTYVYTTDAGDSWLTGTVAGGGLTIAAFLGARVNGSDVEVYCLSTTYVLMRAVITAAAPETCTFATAGYSFSADTSTVAEGGFAYDAVNGRYLFVWASTTSGRLNSISGTNGTSWTPNIGVVVTNATMGSAYVRVTAKPSGGFVVLNAFGSNAALHSTASGASFTYLSAVSGALVLQSTLLYFGARLFFSVVFGALYYSDDDGAITAQFNGAQIPVFRFAGGSNAYSVRVDGGWLVFISPFGGTLYVCSTTNAIDFTCVPYVKGADSVGTNVIFVIGQRVFIPASAGNLARLYKAVNVFAPNLATDYVGLSYYQPDAHGTAAFSTAKHLRIA